jgi:pentatricopeptide repeat protein
MASLFRIQLVYIVVVACILLLLLNGSEAFSFDDAQSSSSCSRRPSSWKSSELYASVAETTGADDRRKQSLEQGNRPLLSLNLNLDALAQRRAAPRAQELLQRIHALYQEGYYEVSPDIVSYNSVLKAWKEDNNPDKAYELLQDMLRIDNSYSADDNTNNDESSYIQVDVISFNTVILAFAKTGNYPQAEDLLRQMQRRSDLPDPDTVTYNAVLYAFAQSPDQGTAIQAENLLREMMTPQNNVNVTVDTTSFNTVLYAWSQMAKDASTLAPAHRAQQLLEHMEGLAAAGNPNVDPDVYSYTTVIQAWAKCEQPIKSQNALDTMTSRGLVPNRFTYTAVMSSLAKSGKAPKAELLLNEMMEAYENGNENLKPDTVAFSSVMDGWARLSSVDKPECAERALKLLARMKRLEHEGMGPNERTYTSVLTALAKSGSWEACERARQLLAEIEAAYESGNGLYFRPTTIHYNTVLNAYARSPRADKALKAAAFVQIMKNHPTCRPDIITYNSLLMCCANAFGNAELKQKSFTIALEAFKGTMIIGEDDTTTTTRRTLQPTSTTFAHFCKASRRLLQPQQQKPVLRKTLKLCCEKGLLNQVVMQQVQTTCASDEEWREVGGEVATYVGWKEKLTISRIPISWRCHARR